MSRTQSVPLWMAEPEEFRSTLKMVLSTAYKNDRRFDRAWTFRYPDETPNLMAEITHLEKGGDRGDYESTRANETTGASRAQGFPRRAR